MADIGRVTLGMLAFWWRRVTPGWAAQSMIRLFCTTGGRSSDILAAMVRLLHPARPLGGTDGVLGPLDNSAVEHIGATLRERGYHVFERRLPGELCDRLVQFAITQEAVVRPREGEAASQRTAVYEPARPLAVRYDFPDSVLINQPDVQALLADPTLLSVAQEYLGTEPIVDVVAMWWHTAFSSQPDAEAAQYYHFDMDRIKWLKFFIYLTDVEPGSGPHSFIAGSHRTGAIPRALLDKGYARLTDQEVESHYAAGDFVEFTGSRGTILAEDTRGLHKGKHVECGHRLVLQIQFSNSLFGATYAQTRFREVHDERLTRMVERFPRVYSNYIRRANAT